MTTHRGIYYFPSFSDAFRYAQQVGAPTDRIIAYERGYAIQLHVSGPYVGAQSSCLGCRWCPAQERAS
jgi:hypothetical protein